MPKYLFCRGLHRWATNTFGGLLEDFCMENDFIISDYAILPQDTFTFSDAHNTTSWISVSVYLGTYKSCHRKQTTLE